MRGGQIMKERRCLPLPPAFCFAPRDHVCEYLRFRLFGKAFSSKFVEDIELYKYHPKELFGQAAPHVNEASGPPQMLAGPSKQSLKRTAAEANLGRLKRIAAEANPDNSQFPHMMELLPHYSASGPMLWLQPDYSGGFSVMPTFNGDQMMPPMVLPQADLFPGSTALDDWAAEMQSGMHSIHESGALISFQTLNQAQRPHPLRILETAIQLRI